MNVLAVLPPLAQAAGPAATAGGSAEFWVFWVVAPLALASGITMVVLRNPVHAALMLVVNFFLFAVLYAMLEAQFLAVIQIIVYAGAIMVLFLFVLMLLGVDREPDLGKGRIRAQRPTALVLGLLLLAALVVGIAGPYLGTDSACNLAADAVTADPGATRCVGLAAVNATEGGNTAGVGGLLFTRYVWPFEAMSVLLVIAALGAMVLGRKRERPEDLVEQGRPAAPPPTADDSGPGVGEDPVDAEDEAAEPDDEVTSQPHERPRFGRRDGGYVP